jgi:hypothetical protein
VATAVARARDSWRMVTWIASCVGPTESVYRSHLDRGAHASHRLVLNGR